MVEGNSEGKRRRGIYIYIYNRVSYHTNTTIMTPCKEYVVESYFRLPEFGHFHSTVFRFVQFFGCACGGHLAAGQQVGHVLDCAAVTEVIVVYPHGPFALPKPVLRRFRLRHVNHRRLLPGASSSEGTRFIVTVVGNV